MADAAYPLAIAKVEQKSTDLERYMEFYGLHPEDEFEFPMDASRAPALGDTFTLTASDSQTLTYSAAGFPVAVCVHDGNYPEAGTSIRNQSHVVVRFLENVSWWGYIQSLAAIPRPQTITTADNLTLRPDQCFGSVVYVSAAKTITLPPARPGMHLFVQVTAAVIASVDPDDGDRIILSGTALDDGDKISSAEAAGDLWNCVTTRPPAGPPGACPAPGQMAVDNSRPESPPFLADI